MEKINQTIFIFETDKKQILKIIVNWDLRTLMVLDEKENVIKRLI